MIGRTPVTQSPVPAGGAGGGRLRWKGKLAPSCTVLYDVESALGGEVSVHPDKGVHGEFGQAVGHSLLVTVPQSRCLGDISEELLTGVPWRRDC